MGQNVYNRMPLSVPVKEKLVPHDLMKYMRDDYDGTKLNMTSDVRKT